MHADVVGSTVLVQRNETEAHARIQDVFKRFSATINRYGGTTRELRGDALLAEFHRTSDAVCAALAFQSENRLGNEGHDPMHPRLRVGIALGEVVTADNTITGAGVVLAQRLEQLAEPDGVCIQGAAVETVPQRLPILFESMGENTVKGFTEAVKIYRAVLKEGHDAPGPEKEGTAHKRIELPLGRRTILATLLGVSIVVAISVVWMFQAREQRVTGQLLRSDVGELKPSVAVLPFDNLSGDVEQEYFADGLADDLITDLSKIPTLFVTARNSSFAFRDRSGDLREIAVALGVTYLLDGSVRRAQNQVRINAQLINAESGQHVWSERFDGDLSNIFALQDEVTTKIVTALEVSLDPNRPKQEPPATFAAYDTLLRALEVQTRFTPADNAEGREIYREAASIDPGYARAHAGIGLTHAIDVNMNWAQDRQKSIDQGLAATARAIELDPNMPRAYFAKGSLLLASGQHREALSVFQRAVELAPNYADGYAQWAFAQVKAGEHLQALESIENSVALNPLSTALYQYVQAIALFHLERYEEALSLLESSVTRNPAFDRVQLMLAATHAYLGNAEEAAWALDEAAILLPGLSLADERDDSVLLVPEDLDRYIDGLRMAGLR